LVVCGPSHATQIARQLPALPDTNVVVEPCPKGTCPAIALAAALIAKHDPDAIMGSFAADHDVRDQAAFSRAVRAAVEAAKAGWLVTIGLTPSRAETGYGYIERTEDLLVETSHGAVFRSARFVEKPDYERASAYVASGRFLWNASMFVWQVRTLLHELERWQPALARDIRQIAAVWDTAGRDEVLASVWANLPTISIDQGVLERSDHVAVVPAGMGWSDVGDWHGLGNLLAHDEHDNSVRGDVIQLGVSNSVIWSETDRVIAIVGLDNVVVVDAPDALLIADRAKAQDVRQIVDVLRATNRTEQV
jgi:mannose-1-phosphate guanylyltransferase